MPTISSATKAAIDSKPLLYEALSQGIVSFSNLAEKIRPELEKELGEDIDLPAVIMALRRYSDRMKPMEDRKIPFNFNTEIIMKTGIMDLTLVKTPSLMQKMKRLYNLPDYDKGETLNIIQGNYEITLVINEKYKSQIIDILKAEKILNREVGLVSFTMSFSKDFLYSPGIIAMVTRKLAWDNINLFEVISTMTEVIIILNSRDAVRAYSSLQSLIEDRT
jgi:hypothetical protein